MTSRADAGDEPILSECTGSARYVEVRLPGSPRMLNLREVYVYAQPLHPSPPLPPSKVPLPAKAVSTAKRPASIQRMVGTELVHVVARQLLGHLDEDGHPFFQVEALGRLHQRHIAHKQQRHHADQHPKMIARHQVRHGQITGVTHPERYGRLATIKRGCA